MFFSLIYSGKIHNSKILHINNLCLYIKQYYFRTGALGCKNVAKTYMIVATSKKELFLPEKCYFCIKIIAVAIL